MNIAVANTDFKAGVPLCADNFADIVYRLAKFCTTYSQHTAAGKESFLPAASRL
jgi:hypothetical protein